MATNDAIDTAPILFAITADMTSSEAVTEMYSKAACCAHKSNLIMQAMIMIAMAYENVCSDTRAVAAAAVVAYVPHTLIEYEAMIDRPDHALYVIAAAVPGAVMPAPDPFVPKLAEVHDDLTDAIDVYIVGNNWNMVFNSGGNAAIVLAQASQQDCVDRGVSGIMKECNFLLTTALCYSFNTVNMQAYQHLANLDFVRESTSPETSFGRIPFPDLRFPHLQLFCRLAHEFFRVGRLRGTTGASQFPLFNNPDISVGLEAYKKSIDPWFVNLRNYRFSTAENAVDFMQASARGSFIYKSSQDPSTSDPLRKEYVTCCQAISTDQNDNETNMTCARLEIHEAALRQRCSAAKIVIAFDVKPPFEKTRQFQTPAAPASNLINETALNNAPPRAGSDKDRYEPCCLWCRQKGHTVLDCDSPAPNLVSKLACDELFAAREKHHRDDRTVDRKARRLTSAATSAVSDDEGDDDLADFSEETFVKIQAMFHQHDEPTKP